MAVVELAPLEGRMRARLEESAWRTVVSGAGVDLPAGARPLPGDHDDSVEAGRGLRSAARLLAAAPVRVEVLAARVDGGAPGVCSTVATDGSVVACVVRAVLPSARGVLELVPGVEVSAFGAEAIVPEVLRQLPSTAGPWPPEARSVTVALEVGIALQAALEGHDERLPTLLATAGLGEEPPEALASLTPLRADVVVTVCHPDGTRRMLRLLAGSRGWVSVDVGPEAVTHRPLDDAALAELVGFELTEALAPLLRAREGRPS